MVDLRIPLHFMGGFLLLIPGVGWSSIFVSRLCELIGSAEDQRPIGHIYAERFFPEPNLRIVRASGYYFVGAWLLGYFGYALTELFVEAHFGNGQHTVLFLVFLSKGVGFALESHGLLPNDSGRVSYAISMALEGLLIFMHSSIPDKNQARGLQHYLLALIAFTASASLGTCILFPNWLFSYILFLVATCWHGIWWLVLGYTFFTNDSDLRMEDIAVEFTLVGLAFLSIGWLIASYLHGIMLRQRRDMAAYEPVKTEVAVEDDPELDTDHRKLREHCSTTCTVC